MIKKKRFLIGSLLILTLCILGLTTISSAEEEHIIPPWLDVFDIRILNNGSYIEPDILPIEKENKVILSPLRFILENSGYKLTWNKNGIIEITNLDEKYILDSKNTKYELENHKGTIMIDSNYFKEIKGLDLTYDIMNRTLVLKSPYKENDVFDYNLGKRTMKTSLGKDLTYTLNGGIVSPKTDKNPLVIVMHGAHGSAKPEDNRFDLGYSYLLKELVKEGYVVVSPNVTIQYSFEFDDAVENERLLHIFEETIKSLVSANEGSNNFGLDLKNKIDFDRVILVGHSRSGYEEFRINSKYKNDSRINIKGLLSMAPAELKKIDYAAEDIPVSIILPELDGDVKDLDGQSIFDSLIDKNRQAQAQLVFLYGANHNAFNEALLIQDEGKVFYTGDIEKLDGKTQRDFLINYSKEFIKSTLNNSFISENLKTNKEDLFGCKALVSDYIPGYTVYNAVSGIEPVKSNDLVVSSKTVSLDMEKNTAGLFTPPGSNDDLKLLNLKWTSNQAQAIFKVGETTKDKKNLSLYLAQDSTDSINNKKNQALTVELKDKSGKVSSFILDKNTKALEYVDGEPVFENKFYSSHTPLSILNINLDNFKNIDTDNIEEVILKFNQTPSGSIFLRSIAFN